jgi:hypothetical protein
MIDLILIDLKPKNLNIGIIAVFCVSMSCKEVTVYIDMGSSIENIFVCALLAEPIKPWNSYSTYYNNKLTSHCL